jgi:hypothetical protein
MSVGATALTIRNHQIQCKVRNHILIGDRSRFEKDYPLSASVIRCYGWLQLAQLYSNSIVKRERARGFKNAS